MYACPSSQVKISLTNCTINFLDISTIPLNRQLVAFFIQVSIDSFVKSKFALMNSFEVECVYEINLIQQKHTHHQKNISYPKQKTFQYNM